MNSPSETAAPPKKIGAWKEFKDNAEKHGQRIDNVAAGAHTLNAKEIYLLWVIQNLIDNQVDMVPGNESKALFAFTKMVEDAPTFKDEWEIDTLLVGLVNKKLWNCNFTQGQTIH